MYSPIVIYIKSIVLSPQGPKIVRSSTVEVISFDDRRASSRICAEIKSRSVSGCAEVIHNRTHVRRAVSGIVAALDARPRPGRLDELNVVFVTASRSVPLLAEADQEKHGTYPVQTLPCGFPLPPAPPLESY
jgi:hypothetical protein